MNNKSTQNTQENVVKHSFIEFSIMIPIVSWSKYREVSVLLQPYPWYTCHIAHCEIKNLSLSQLEANSHIKILQTSQIATHFMKKQTEITLCLSQASYFLNKGLKFTILGEVQGDCFKEHTESYQIPSF